MERLQLAVKKAERGRERLRQTFIEKFGVDLRTWRPRKLTPAEMRRELRAANDAHQKEQHGERDGAHGGSDRLLRIGEVMQLVGLKRASLWKLEREKKFPARVEGGGRAVRWLGRAVLRWIAGL